MYFHAKGGASVCAAHINAGSDLLCKPICVKKDIKVSKMPGKYSIRVSLIRVEPLVSDKSKLLKTCKWSLPKGQTGLQLLQHRQRITAWSLMPLFANCTNGFLREFISFERILTIALWLETCSFLDRLSRMGGSRTLRCDCSAYTHVQVLPDVIRSRKPLIIQLTITSYLLFMTRVLPFKHKQVNKFYYN